MCVCMLAFGRTVHATACLYPIIVPVQVQYSVAIALVINFIVNIADMQVRALQVSHNTRDCGMAL